jgi:hypothetical protein
VSDSPQQQPPRIVYIASVTHSGSTLLDLVLGSHSQLQSLGELKVLCRAKQEKRERVLADRCSCGARDKLGCPFWCAVEERLRHTLGGGLRDLDVDHPDPATFIAHNRALFDAIVRAGGTPWIVDSSKSPRRLGRLLGARVFDVRPVHLTRSPYGVTYSHTKKGRSTVRGALRYAKTQLALERLLSREPHLALRYEDFVASPADETTRIMSYLGLPFEADQLDWSAPAHHTLCGNHMRFAPTSEIRSDEAWREELSAVQKAVIGVLTWPVRAAGGRGGAQSSRTAR